MALILVLNGCTATVSEQELAKMTPAQRYKLVTEKCESDARTWLTEVKYEAARWMRVEAKDVPRVFCKRVIAGLVSGRIKEKDLANVKLGGGSSLWRVLRG